MVLALCIANQFIDADRVGPDEFEIMDTWGFSTRFVLSVLAGGSILGIQFRALPKDKRSDYAVTVVLLIGAALCVAMLVRPSRFATHR